MEANNPNNGNFLNVLLSLQVKCTNPFSFINNQKSENPNKYLSPFCIYEDSLDKEVRCPICLGRVGIASKPTNCTHVFCEACIMKWLKSSRKCPVCRRIVLSIIRVDINENWVESQMDLYSI